MNPSSSYFDPLIHTHSDSDLDLGLERLYSLESIGLKDSELGSVDQEKIALFKNSIIFKDGKYMVDLPWYEEILEQVPSNHHVAIATLKRVVKGLQAKGLVEAYGDVFRQQLRDGIIEKIVVHPSQYSNYVFIPHRAVVKTEQQVNTKLRIVFNCSLKIGGAPSLNQASYPGIDLMASLFRLLCSFRSSKYVIIGDIAKAFLQIRLKSEADRNRFAFFWEEKGKLQIYRYTSIVFGLSASPFILNYIIRHHADQYEDDVCSRLLKSHFYMDNFIVTSSNLDELREIYHTAVSRMAEGGFDLCSWQTNSDSLRQAMVEAGNSASHECSEERVLGYLFNFKKDRLRLADFQLESVKTKRELLSQVSKVFDPLCLFLPVTIRGRLLMRQTWEKEIGWDDTLPSDFVKKMG